MENNKVENKKSKQESIELDKKKKKKKLETISTILLAAATVISAWCVFQSSQWSGEQYFRIDDETVANQFRLQHEVAAAQRKTAELQMFLEYASAVSVENNKFADFLVDRFPPSLKEAFEVWKKTDPGNNPNAPSSPFSMKEYVLPEVNEAAKYAERAKSFKKAANVADDNSDNYVLISLVLSTVLFFSGMTGVTDSLTNKRVLIGVATVIFSFAIIAIFSMPVIF